MVALALMGLGFVAREALAARATILPAASLAGQRAYPSGGLPGSTPRVIRLRVIDPMAYARQKRRSTELAKANRTASASGGFGSALSSPQTIGPRAVLSGALNSSGLSAAAQIEAKGPEGDVTPPDTTGAIGPNAYLEFVNSEVAAYSRETLSMISSADLSTFTGGVGVCDPQIKYDPQTSRWFYAALRCDGTLTQNRLYLGFSKTSDPTDFSIANGHGWCGYEYNTEKALEDYPKLGLDSQHIIIGTNSFNAKTENFVSAHIIAGPKPTGAIEGACPPAPALKEFGSPLQTSVGNPAFTPEPATVADASLSGFVVSADVGEENIMIWRVGGTASVPTLEALGAPKVPVFKVAPPVPQPGSEDELDSLDTRLTQAVAAADPNASGAEAVWTQHTIAGGAGSVVRWYELVPGKVEVRQFGTISDPTEFVFNGAIAPTLTGGAVINYNTAGSSALVQIIAQSRVGSAPLGTMNTPITLASSSAVDADFSCPSETGEGAPCRWGDYAGASVDPTGNNTVWGSNQVNGPNALGSSQWATQNFALTANDLTPAASFTISPNPATTGSPVGFNGAASSDPDGSIASFSWNFGDGTTGGGATPSHTFGVAGTYAVTLTVTDNGGETNAVSHQMVVTAATTGSTSATGSTSTPTTPAVVAPSSRFSAHRATFNPKTGTITFTTSVLDPGTFTWVATFQNGRFGAFASSNKCKKGFVKLGGKCRPARIIFAKGRKLVRARGRVRVVLKPSASARKALNNALRQKKGVPVTLVFSFKSSLGGSAVSHTQSLTVKLRK
jgi:hypothetical protein